MNWVVRSAFLLASGILSASVGATDVPNPGDFAWRATLALPAGASVARVTLPPDAMLQLHSSDARDVRVFNADAEAVAFAFTVPAGVTPNPALVQTGVYIAHPLFAAARGQRAAKGSVEVHLDQGQDQGSVWVRFADQGSAVGATDAAVTPLQSVLFDTRGEKQSITALTLQAELPANALIHFTVATSADLAQWTPVEVRGPLFRFDGAGAPANRALELPRTLRLEGRYLRLNWEGQTGVQVHGFIGSVAPTGLAPARVRAPLPAGILDGSASVTWPIYFATPMAALHLSSSRNNTLIPVRILGRNDAAQPWRQLAQAVVYRVGAAGQEKNNPPVALGGTSVRWLRVEATNGMALPGSDLQATVEFEPIQLVFLASGKGPFELALGRSGTAAAAVQPSLISSVVAGRLEDLPTAAILSTRLTQNTSADSAIKRVLPLGLEPRSIILWAVLLAAVLILAAVAYGLLRQLSGKPGADAVSDNG